MKMNTAQRQYESTVSGQKIKMGFAADAATHLAELMSNSVYQDKYGSIVREVVSNAVDANQEARSTQKVQVKLTNVPSLSNAVGEFSVRDFGPGITPNRIENIFTQYFASTKRDSNEQIGGFGIGAKSPFAYTPVFQVTTYIDGVKRSYLMEKSSAERTCTMINEIETDESNGTLITIPVYSRADTTQFVMAIENQLVLLGHMLSISLPGEFIFNESKVFDYGSFLRIEQNDRTLCHNGLMVSLGNVLYKIPHLDGDSYLTNFVIKLNIGEINPTLSREGLELNDNAKELLDQKLSQVNSVFETWQQAQSGYSTDLKLLYGYGSRKNELVYPDTHQIIASTRHFHLTSSVEGWPKEVQEDRFTSIVGQLLEPSAKLDLQIGKWRSVSTLSGRDIVKGVPNTSATYTMIRKRGDQRLGTVWKEFFQENNNLTTTYALIFNVNQNFMPIIQEVCRYGLNNVDENRKEEIHNKIEQIITVILNEFFQKHTEKYADYTPTEKWLVDRKENLKLRRKTGSNWTAEMLKTELPVKVVQNNAYTRTTKTYKELKDTKAIVIQYKYAKAIEWNVVLPKDLYCASDGNFKRLQKSGVECWDLAKLKQIILRQQAKNLEHSQWQWFKEHIHSYCLQGFTLMRLGCLKEHLTLPPRPKKSNGWIYSVINSEIFDIEAPSVESFSILQHNGAVYTPNKVAAQFRNIQKQLQKTPAGTVILNSILHQHTSDDLYRQAINSL